MLKIIFIVLTLILNNVDIAYGLSIFPTTNQVQPILNPITIEKESLKKEETKLADEQIRFTAEERSINNKLNEISQELSKIDEKLKIASETEKDFLVKFITLLNEKKQILSLQTDYWKEIVTIIEQNIKNLKSIISFKEFPKTTKQSASYSWKEFKEASKKLYNKKTEQKNLENKIEALIKQQETSAKFLDSNNTQKENKQSALKAVEEELERGIKDPAKIHERTLLKEELSFLDEKEILYNLKIKKFKLEVILKNNELAILSVDIEQKNKEIKEIERNLIPTNEDVNLAQDEWGIESQKAQISQNTLEQKKKPAKKELEILRKKLDELKEKESQKETLDQSEQILLSSEITKIQTYIEKDNNYLKIIEYEKNKLDLIVASKKLQFDMIKSYYQSSLDSELAQTWLDNFKNQREIAQVLSGELGQKINDEINVQTEAIRKLDQIKVKIEEINLKQTSIFKGKQKRFETAIGNLRKANLNLISIKDSRSFAIINDQKNINEQIKNTIDFISKQLETKNISKNIWSRSRKAISINDLSRSLYDAEKLLTRLFWDTPNYLSPQNIIKGVNSLSWPNYLGLLIFIIFFIFYLFGTKKLFIYLQKICILKLKKDKSRYYLNIYRVINTLVGFALNNFKVFFVWLFIYLHIIFDFKYIFSSVEFLAIPYVIAVFHIISIPVWIYLSSKLLAIAKELNKELSFVFFAEKTQNKFIFLLTSIMYSTAILIPLRQAFLNYIDTPSEFPNVMLAAYSLILVCLILLFFGKEDVLTLIPAHGKVLPWIRKYVESHYYPVFIFLMSLLILSNPYIGYLNLAWYLAFAVPSTVTIIYGIMIVHEYIRKWSMPFFLKEENDEIVDNFEQSKTYYGFFIILTFIGLLFIAFVFITRIWQLGYSINDLLKNLSIDWTIPLGQGARFGIIQLLILISFILSGFLISTFLKKFVLNKLFEIFRTEPGTQNTIFKIAHYIIISLVIILGFATIQLKEFITIVGSFLAIGTGFALKDLAADYVAGLFILIERPIEIGNFIQLDESTMGTVQKISARATTIRTARNFSLIVPNKNLVSNQIINWGDGRMSVGFELKLIVAYNQDFGKIKKIITTTVQGHETILKVPGLAVRLEEFSENGATFFVRAFVSARRVKEQWEIASQVRLAIVSAFKENNITIAYPQLVIHNAKIAEK